jgi:hypothetical protein
MAVLHSQTTVRQIWQYFTVKQQSGQYGSTSQSNNSQDNMAVVYSQTTVWTIWQYFTVKQVRTTVTNYDTVHSPILPKMNAIKNYKSVQTTSPGKTCVFKILLD